MLVSGADLAAAARTTLQTYLPAQLAAGVSGRPALPEPTKYDEVPTFDAIRRVKRSVLAVSVPRTLSDPERFGDGSYDVVWLLSVAVWHEQKDDLPLLTAAADYVAAVRAVIVKHQTLGGIAVQSVWTGESVDLVGDEQTALTVGMGICEFAVRTPAVVDETPLPETGDDGPVVDEATVYVTPNQ
jgi:hypothetical protein